jgi:hypothetical protein
MNKRVSLVDQKDQARRAGERIIKMEQMGKRVLTLLEAVKKINVLMDDLEWERDRMTSSGQETLDKYWKLAKNLQKDLQKIREGD